MNRYMPMGTMDKDNEDGPLRLGDWRSGTILTSLNQQGANSYSFGAIEVRLDFCSFFNNEGCVPWPLARWLHMNLCYIYLPMLTLLFLG